MRRSPVASVDVTVPPGPAARSGAQAGRLQPGSAGLRRLRLAMAAAGLGGFAMLYSTQALLPSIGATFGVGPTSASLTVTVTSGLVGLTVLPLSGIAERLGRTRVMAAGLSVACAAVAAGAVCTAFWELIATRAAVGLALAGVVAVAMGHISDEVEPSASGRAIGLYVAGTSVGGLLGRLIPAGIESLAGWRWSLVGLAIAGAVAAATFARIIPPPRLPPSYRPERGGRAARQHLRDPAIVWLCAAALLLMGGFVATYNYLTYRLTESPFHLPKSLIGLIFIVYLAGTVAASRAAAVVARIGRRRAMYGSIGVAVAGLALTLPGHLTSVIIGLALFTAGFFASHSTASAWVTQRAPTGKSHVSALYLAAYYIGSSVGGTVIGAAWTGGGWPATVLTVAACYLLAASCVTAAAHAPERCADAGAG
jgi:YNFM family putative membrane transporter